MAINLDEMADIEFWTRPMADREEAFATLRGTEELVWFPEPDLELLPPGRGFWALTRHAEVVEASRRPEDFCSGQGVNVVDLPQPFLDFFGSMISMDDPRHVRMRRIVSRAFTPKFLESLKADVEEIAKEIVDDIAPKGECDFVTDVAALLPLRVIVDLMGIPRSEEKFIFERSNVIIGFTDPEYVPELEPGLVMASILNAGQDLAGLVRELGEDRVKNPRNDLTTALVTAEVDGEKLTPEELASFFILLVVAGNETTRNAVAHGLDLLTEHPDQKAAWIADLEGVTPSAVEEIVRVASPVMHFRRTVTRDGVRLGDKEFAEGDKVVLWYWSANRDERVFDAPERFDVRRVPNDHIGFGGPGPHYCLGAHLARREISVAFRELLTRLPDIHAAAPPERLRSAFINGIKHLKAEYTPA